MTDIAANTNGSFTLADGSVVTIPSITVVAPVSTLVPVSPPPPPPVVSNVVAACEVVVSGQNVTFTDKTVSARALASVLVGYGLGVSPVEIGAAGTITKAYPNPGTFSAALTATDDAGVKSVVFLKITVPGTSDNTYTAGQSTGTAPPPTSTTPPTVLSATARLMVAGLTVFALDTSTPTDKARIKSVAWDWGDGSQAEQAQTPTWASNPMFYAQRTLAPGTYTLTQTVTDSSGATDTATQTVTVAAWAEPPVVGADGTVTVVGEIANGIPVNAVIGKGQRVPLVPNKLLGSIVWHADGKSVCLENGYCGLTDDLFGEFVIYNGVTEVFRGPLAIWAYSRTRPFWLEAPTVLPTADLSKFPNYPKGTGKETLYAQYMAGDNSPMSQGALISSAIGNGGEHPYLGSMPEWDADYLVNPTTDNATVVFGCADACSVLGFIMLDPTTNKMLDVTQWPKATDVAPLQGSAGNPIAKYQTFNRCSLGQAQTHAPVFCALACELRGTDYDRETLSLWCNYVNSLYENYAYRLPAGCTGTTGIPRATGRGLVVLTYATMLSDRPAYFDAWMKATLADFQAKFGTQTGIQVVQKSFGYPHNGFGPWLQHLLVYGIGCAMQHGYKAEGQWALDYFATAILDSVLVTQDELSTIYNSQWSDDNGVVAKDWAQGLQFAALNQPKIAAALVCAEGSQALQAALGSGFPAGYYSGYPTEPTGYPAMMQPAMAVIREMATDQTRAIAGWTKFAANAVAHIDYSHNPKYNVIP